MRTLFIRAIPLSFILSLCLCVLSSYAEQIQIHVTGLNFSYDGTDIYDSNAKAGGISNTAQATPITTIDFYKDKVLQGSLTSNIFADLLIDQVQNIPVDGGTVVTGDSVPGFGFDLLENTGTTKTLLSLNIKNLTLNYMGGELYIAVGGLASSVDAQNLPFGLNISNDAKITLVFSSSDLNNVTSNANDYLTGFDAFGTSDVTVKQTTTPEPSTTAALLGMSVIGLFTYFRRRR